MSHQVPVLQHNESSLLKLFESWRVRVLALGVGISAIALYVTLVLPGDGTDIDSAPSVGAIQDVTPASFDEFASLFQPRESIPVAPARTAPVVSAPSEPAPVADTGAASEPDTQEFVLGTTLRPTPFWVNVFSPQSLFNGQPLAVGDVVTAYDGEGVLIGKTTVEVEGKYGLMALYMDDPSTTVDEGAVPGESISFRVNGEPALVVGPHEPVWSANGDVLMLNLASQPE